MNKFKDKYNIFCENTNVPIFSQPWWMDAVCGEHNWDVYVVEKGGRIIAAMPYYLESRNGMSIITKAKLTQNNGIIINYPDNQKYCTKLDYEESIINEVCDFIESLSIQKYEQQYHYSFDNWLPFYWRGYKAVTRYTYVIENTSDLGIVENSFSANARNMLRKASQHTDITENIDMEKFYLVNHKTFQKQNISTPFDLELVSRLYEECKIRDCCKMIAAVDDNNNIHSAALLVWDHESVYFLINGSDPKFNSSQANTLIIYESIKTASILGKKFDFEGSVIKPIEKAFRQYGGIRKPYFRISKEF